MSYIEFMKFCQNHSALFAGTRPACKRLRLTSRRPRGNVAS